MYLNVVMAFVLGQLKANNTQLMEEAVQAMQNLAQQCSDHAAVQDVVTHLFKILGGELIAYLLVYLFIRNIVSFMFGFAHLNHNDCGCRI